MYHGALIVVQYRDVRTEEVVQFANRTIPTYYSSTYIYISVVLSYSI